MPGRARQRSEVSRRGQRLAIGAVKVAVSAAAIGLLAARVDAEAFAEAVGAARPLPLLLGFAVYVLGQALCAYRWLAIARRVGFIEGFATLVRFLFIAMFFNLFGPSTLGGDVVRGLYLGERDGRRIVALNTVVFDRLVGLVMLIAVLVAAMALFGTFSLPGPLLAVTVVAGMTVVIGWWVVPRLARKLLGPQNRVRLLIETEIGAFWSDRRLLAEVSCLSVVFHVWQVLAVWLVLVAAGADVPWQYAFIFHPLVSILGAVPVSFAGLGIREVGYVYFLAELQGIAEPTALAFAILWLAVLLGSAIVGGLVFLASGSSLPGLPPPRDSGDRESIGG